jgi:hypothetical protein
MILSNTTRDRIAAGLMLLAALGALAAFAAAVVTAVNSSPATQQVEWWRALGFLMFAAIFALLAFGPRRYPYLWELVILNKAALTIVEMFLIPASVQNAAASAAADAILSVLLLASYILSRGYQSWYKK